MQVAGPRRKRDKRIYENYTEKWSEDPCSFKEIWKKKIFNIIEASIK